MRCAAGRRRATSGFTLLEVLVALVVLGVLMATLAQGMRIGLRAATVAPRIGAGVRALEATDRLVRELLGRAAPRDPFTGDRAFTGTPGGIEFTTTMPDGLGAPIPVEADVSLSVTDAHRLVLRWRPHHRVWIAPAPTPVTETLLEGVGSLQLAFFEANADGHGGRWLNSWPPGELPRLVSMRVVFPSGDRRHWPAIVAGTMRKRPPE